MTPLKDILTRIRDLSPTERDKRSKLEQLAQHSPQNDPKSAFSEVLSWKDWSRVSGR